MAHGFFVRPMEKPWQALSMRTVVLPAKSEAAHALLAALPTKTCRTAEEVSALTTMIELTQPLLAEPGEQTPLVALNEVVPVAQEPSVEMEVSVEAAASAPGRSSSSSSSSNNSSSISQAAPVVGLTTRPPSARRINSYPLANVLKTTF